MPGFLFITVIIYLRRFFNRTPHAVSLRSAPSQLQSIMGIVRGFPHSINIYIYIYIHVVSPDQSKGTCVYTVHILPDSLRGSKSKRNGILTCHMRQLGFH